MKKLAITIACLTLSLYTYGQGTIQFVTYDENNPQPVKDAMGNWASTAYQGQLWGSTSGATGSFAPIGTALPFFGDTADSGAGFIIGDIVTVNGVLGKADYWVELHAWKTADPNGEYGKSAPFKIVLGGDDGSGGVPGFPASLTGAEGLQSFQMVPEPSTIALGLLGAAALLLRRRN